MSHGVSELNRLKEDIESFDRADQARALKILLDNEVPHDENANGVFVNMANIPEQVMNELTNYAGYVKLQQTYLQTQEKEKEELRQNYFKPSLEGGAC